MIVGTIIAQSKQVPVIPGLDRESSQNKGFSSINWMLVFTSMTVLVALFGTRKR